MEQIYGVMLEILSRKIDFYIRWKKPTDDINDSASDLEKKIVSLIFLHQKQDIVWVYIAGVMKVSLCQ